MEQIKYGRLTVITEPFQKLPSQLSKRTRKFVTTKCDCGNIKDVQVEALNRRVTVSCGCYQTEARIKHGIGHSIIYQVYCDMMYRCYNPNNKSYKSYGGRGISVCDEWRNNPKAFYDWAIQNGYREDLQLDREKNSGNYEPGNCRFVTQLDNNRNRDFCVMNPTRVRVAKYLHFNIGFGYAKIARLYSVSRPTIANAVNEKTWAEC